MAKILLVEDDNNLREIYQARLQAEGYDVVAANDGEEALVVAKSENPDLVISDVMMPKISGFEMLDILRNTEGLKQVKVIMLTALGQSEDQSRADKLGADRYLVKSQVTLEDIVNVAQDLLVKAGALEAPATVEAVAEEAPAVAAVAPAPAEPTPTMALAEPPSVPVAVAAPAVPTAAPTPAPVPAPQPAPEPPTVTAIPVVPLSEPTAQVQAAPVIQMPVTDPGPDLSLISDAPAAENETGQPQSTAQEEQAVEKQIESFVDDQTGAAPAEVTPTTEPEVTTPETVAEPSSAPAASATTSPEQQQALDTAVGVLNGQADPVETATAPDAAVPDVGVTHKKVIQPISNTEEPKKSLEQLLAEEAAKEASPSIDTPATPITTPAPVIATEPVTQPMKPVEPPKNPNDFDPNSIAL